MYKYITAFEGKDGCKIKPADKPNQRIVFPNNKKEISIKYIISYDPKVMDGVSFGPNVSSSHFHVAGCQWLLPIGNISLKHKQEIEIVDAPTGWHFYSSISSNPTKTLIYDSYENLISTAIGGGSQSYTQLTIKGKPVYVFVAGNYNISKDEILNAVNKIVSVQRDWFNDYDFPFYNITILPRTGIIAGTCIPNLFVCFIKSEITKDELNVLFSHEMFHTWLPNKIYIKLPKGEFDVKYEWVSEGFTDYFARKILLDAGLMTQEKFAELVNRDIINIADNPNLIATYADLIAASNNGKYGTAYKKLSYYRGALIALNWETKIREAGKGQQLKNLIRDLYDVSSKNNGEISEQTFFDITMNYGLDAKKDLEQYIIQGLPITPLSDALGKKFELKETSVPSFDPSFSLEQTFKTRKIKGVAGYGNAYNAGLRNEMDFIDIRNSNRFGNGWSVDKPMSVTVKLNNTEKTFDFFPQGKPMTLMLYYVAEIVPVFSSGKNKKTICITVDDLPFRSRYDLGAKEEAKLNSKFLSALRKHNAHAIGFVNEGRLYSHDTLDKQRIKILSAWIGYGNDLGNHTKDHVDYNANSLAKYSGEIMQGEIITNGLLKPEGKKVSYFRHPYLHRGNSKLKADSLIDYLNSIHHKEAPVTIDNSDWIFALAYDSLMKTNDTVLMKKVGADYICYMEDKLSFYEKQCDTLFKRQISQILILHLNALNSDYLDGLLKMMEHRGYNFISLNKTLEDPIYKSKDEFYGEAGISWIHRWAITNKVSSKVFAGEPLTPSHIMNLANVKDE